MQNGEKTRVPKIKITSVIYKSMSFFVLVYGLITLLFYLFSLLSPLFLNVSPVFSGYSSFSKPAFIFLIILLLLLYLTVFVDGVLLLKLSAYSITIYFFVLIVYYSVNIWVTGDVEVLFLSVEILYGLVLSCLKKKLLRDREKNNK